LNTPVENIPGSDDGKCYSRSWNNEKRQWKAELKFWYCDVCVTDTTLESRARKSHWHRVCFHNCLERGTLLGVEYRRTRFLKDFCKFGVRMIHFGSIHVIN